ncbi:MAG TPA: TetR/AcrR family transcriptional regulator [Microlunatus sp.]
MSDPGSEHLREPAQHPEAETDGVEGTPEGRRIIELLWSGAPPAARGPKPKFSLDDIVSAGVAVADAEGLDSLSMRRVANRLGVGAMSLYTYVPGRSELLELMIDAAYGELELPKTTATWRNRLEFLTGERWQLYRRHPWLLDYNMNRLPLGPHVLDVEEAMYAAVAAAGLRGTDVVAVTNLIGWQLLGAARAQISDADEERHTGTSSEAYWMSRVSFWTTHFDYQRFPTMAQIWEAGGFDDEAGYDADQGIARLLDAIEIMIKNDLLPSAAAGPVGGD